MIPIMLEHCLKNNLNIILLLRYGVGASRDPCSEVFQGPHPFSERESRALRLRDIHVNYNVHVCIKYFIIFLNLEYQISSPGITKTITITITITITRDYLQKLTKVQAAISVHSFGNVLIYPWGYKVITVTGDG